MSPSKKHLLILGAGASMSLVPKPRHTDNKYYDPNHKSRMPSGDGLVAYISQYHQSLVLFIQRLQDDDNPSYTFEQFVSDMTTLNNPPSNEIPMLDGVRLSNAIKCSNESVRKVIQTKSYTYQDIKNTIMWDNRRYSTNKLHYLYLCLASLLVQLHNPISIDYFARNIDFFAHDWIIQIKHDDPSCNTHKKVVIKIQKYLKLIVYEYINYKQIKTIEYYSNNNHRDYIKQIIWHLTLLANKEKKPEKEPIKEFINNHLSIITFNYDTLVEELLERFQLNKEINHVYGCINPIQVKYPEYLSLECLCNNNNDKNDTAMKKCLDVANKSINWIRSPAEAKNLIDQYKNLINESQNIYFLGFGFDTTNLFNIGLGLNEQSTILARKKIFVSQGNGRIMSILSNVIRNHGDSSKSKDTGTGHNFQKRHGDDKVFINSNYKSEDGCLISMNDINTAFEQDFDLN